MSKQKNSKGFTIIEVVLVLAIAGLIFLVVFLALPALQRGQRDNQRRSDLSRFMSQVTNYQSNSQGALPALSAWNTTFKSSYLTNNNQSFHDPTTGNEYSVSASSSVPGSAPTMSAGDIRVYTGARCGGSGWGVESVSAASRTFAAIVYQEQGGFYCQNN